MNTVFWRDTPLTAEESELLMHVLDAHAQCAFRHNPSSLAVATSAQGSRDYGKAICSALLTLGGPHAPLKEAYAMLAEPPDWTAIEPLVEMGWLIPGWGNSFVKDKPDPSWEKVDEALKRFPVGARLAEITDWLHKRGRLLYPNPGGYTAATAITLGMPSELAPYLFVSGRLEAWSLLFLNAISPRKEVESPPVSP